MIQSHIAKIISKEGFFVLLVLVMTVYVAFAQTSGASYYVSPSGVDAAGRGTQSSPWKTLAYACTNVTTSGSTIVLSSGTFTETTPCNLAIGVSIRGAGIDQTKVISTVKAANMFYASINLKSTTEGTNGNQSISDFWLDGLSLTADDAIFIQARSNVKIFNMKITDFYANAIYFYGRYGTWGTPPSVYSTGNELRNSTVINSGTRKASATRGVDFSQGLIGVSGQKGLLIHDNVFDQTARPTGENGTIIDAVAGNNEALKYYNNKSYKPDSEGANNWNFHIEHWNSTGGMEVYNNEFWGGAALNPAGDFSTKGAYAFSWSIHDNLIALRSQLPAFSTPYMAGISFEGDIDDALVYNNRFRNLAQGVTFSVKFNATHQRNIKIYRNIFENIGIKDSTFSYGIFFDVTKPVMTMENIYIENNTFTQTDTTAGKVWGALEIDSKGTTQNIYFRNNIVTDSKKGYLSFWQSTGGTVRNIYSENNLLYNNAANNGVYYLVAGTVVTNLVQQNNVVANPLYATTRDFDLQTTSPALNTGLVTGISSYKGTAPERGAIECGAPIVIKR